MPLVRWSRGNGFYFSFCVSWTRRIFSRCTCVLGGKQTCSPPETCPPMSLVGRGAESAWDFRSRHQVPSRACKPPSQDPSSDPEGSAPRPHTGSESSSWRGRQTLGSHNLRFSPKPPRGSSQDRAEMEGEKATHLGDSWETKTL